MIRTAFSRTLFIALAAAAAVLAGCEITEGEDGVLLFDDTTTGNLGFDHAAAVGGELIVRVDCFGCVTPQVTDAQSSDTAVFDVSSFDGDEVVLRGVAPGRAFLEVSVAGEGSDRIEITFGEVATSAFRLEPWGDALPLPPALWEGSGGFAMLAGSEIDVRAFPKDADGERLTGFGAVDWQVDGGADFAFPDGRRDDRISLTAPTLPEGSGEASGEGSGEGSTEGSGDDAPSFVLSTSTGEMQTIAVVGQDDIASLELAIIADPLQTVADGAALTLMGGTSYILHLVARTDAGAYVSGAGASLAELAIGASLDGIATDVAQGLLEDDASLTDDADDVRTFVERGFLLELADAEGSGELMFTWGDRSIAVTLTVVPATAPTQD